MGFDEKFDNLRQADYGHCKYIWEEAQKEAFGQARKILDSISGKSKATEASETDFILFCREVLSYKKQNKSIVSVTAKAYNQAINKLEKFVLRRNLKVGFNSFNKTFLLEFIRSFCLAISKSIAFLTDLKELIFLSSTGTPS